METKRLKIVVISDSPSNAAYFTATISAALPGTEVYIALDGLQGVQLAKDNEPDVILIDISITHKDSLKVSRIIRKDKALQLTPMLFITDLESDRKLRNRAIKAGAEAFLIKPIDDAILITQLTAMAKIKERNILINTQKEQLETLVKHRTRDLKKEINERKRLEVELRRSEEIFRTYIEKAPIGIFVVDASGKYSDANVVACQLMGRTREEVLKLSISDFLTPAHLDRGLAGFRELASKGFLNAELKVRRKNSQDYWIILRGAKISDNCFIAFCSDITDRKEKEAKVEYLSYHDSLTGVYNRTFYEDEIKRLDTEENIPFSVIISDINGLKLINDTLGHSAGDAVLIETSKLLSKFLRKNDILARVGGDEFSILLPRTSSQEAQKIFDRIQLASRACKIDLSKEPMPLSISLGYATKKRGTESFSHINKLAEDYMYRQKLLERESFHSTFLESLRLSLFERSHETEKHAARLIQLSHELGMIMGLGNDDLNDLALLSSLHDIGKISIDNSILVKPGKLTDHEWLEMKKHPAIGYRIAMASTELRSIAEYILCHHERWDGTGYPQGLSGENIPLLARVISIVDAYDAMTSDRPYRKAMSREAAIAEISDNSGSQFDPKIATLFLTLV
ncbi:MAG: diguanylate cyclase [Bacillota bacterium]|nr:diguanylate cyclase [Bacillota bacterium]